MLEVVELDFGRFDYIFGLACNEGCKNMMDSAKDMEVVLGRTLAETAELNSPEHIAGAEASAAVQRACREADPTTRNRRRFRIAVLIMVMVFALTAAAAWFLP